MKSVQEVNTGSMADIAFLLLIFFLVTTSIDMDYGITSNISKPFEMPDSISVVQSTLLINQSGKLLLNDKHVTINALRYELAENFETKKSIKNVIVVKSDRDVSYEYFIGALNESKRAFKVYYNLLSQDKYGSEYASLSDSLQLRISKLHPVALVEDVVTN